MIIDVSKIEKSKEIDLILELEEQLLASVNILSIDKINVKGTITTYNTDDYYINLDIIGKIFVPCSICLKPATVDIDINADGSFNEMMEEIGLFDRKTGNSIDILPIIWENILTEIPIKVNCEEHQENWEPNEVEEQNSAFDKLKDLL